MGNIRKPDIESSRRDSCKALKNRHPESASGFTIDRRIFLRRAAVTGTTIGAAAYGLIPIINTVDIAASAQVRPFRLAWISDTHLCPSKVTDRFVEQTQRAIDDIKNMDPAPDFLIFGGDLAHLGSPDELELGQQILSELDLKQYFIPGEHDWYLDLGKKWQTMFGRPNWSFDHNGTRFIGLDTVSHAPNYWSATNMTPRERMVHAAALDGPVAGPWAGVGDEQLKWLQDTVSGLSKDHPIVVFSHNPLYDYYPPWNFWIRDWREVNEVLGPFKNITNIHGHTHQPSYKQIGNMRSIGMLATSWPWPYAPEGGSERAIPVSRINPGDHYDGIGWNELTIGKNHLVSNRYFTWSYQDGTPSTKA